MACQGASREIPIPIKPYTAQAWGCGRLWLMNTQLILAKAHFDSSVLSCFLLNAKQALVLSIPCYTVTTRSLKAVTNLPDLAIRPELASACMGELP